MSDEWEPNWASPPGDTLVEALQERGWTQRHLAQQTGVSEGYVSQIVHATSTISVKFAVALEALDVGTARFWLHREADYRLALHRLRTQS